MQETLTPSAARERERFMKYVAAIGERVGHDASAEVAPSVPGRVRPLAGRVRRRLRLRPDQRGGGPWLASGSGRGRRRTATKRYRVEYRLGGRESKTRYGGSFRTRRERDIRAGWIEGELAALRVPELRLARPTSSARRRFAQAAERWQATRVDVAEATAVQHRPRSTGRCPLLGDRRVDAITPQPTSPTSSPQLARRRARRARRSARR